MDTNTIGWFACWQNDCVTYFFIGNEYFLGCRFFFFISLVFFSLSGIQWNTNYKLTQLLTWQCFLVSCCSQVLCRRIVFLVDLCGWISIMLNRVYMPYSPTLLCLMQRKVLYWIQVAWMTFEICIFFGSSSVRICPLTLLLGCPCAGFILHIIQHLQSWHWMRRIPPKA